MMQVNLLTTSYGHNRRLSSTKLALKEFLNISEHNRNKVSLKIYSHTTSVQKWTDILNSLNINRMDVQIVEMIDDEYISKIQKMKLTDAEYFCKWDDDIFINRHVWDFMIENLSVLNEPEHSVLSPIFTNGIPSVDMFIEDFFSEEEKEYVFSLFLEEGIVEEIWGCSYSELNKKIKNMSRWDSKEYWRLVSEHNQTKGREHFLPHYFSIVKGVHPARFSERYNKFILEFTLKNSHKVFDKGNYYLDNTFFTPYFCNNLFISTTQFYKDSQLQFVDGWDEGQLTMLANKTKKTPVYVRNSYGIHMAYGCTKNQAHIETEFCSKFFEKWI